MNYFFNKRAMVSLALLSALFITSCSSDDDDEYGDWVTASSFDGSNRSNSVSFTIGDNGYIVGGEDEDGDLADTWLYNLTDNKWVEKDLHKDSDGNTYSSFVKAGGVPRRAAVGFSIGDKGYYGTGYDYDNNERLNDFWEYDSSTDTWTQLADFPGTPRYNAIGFSVGNYGFIGTGWDGSEQKNFYRYDPSTDTWELFSGFPGEKRHQAYTFKIDDVVYIGGGIQSGSYQEDFYSFDGTTFTELEDLDDDDDDDDDYSILVYDAAAFSINGKGYLTTGVAGALTTNTWEYDPATDTWDELPAFEGTARQGASTFTFDTRAFVTMGESGSFFHGDLWELKPEQISDEDDN